MFGWLKHKTELEKLQYNYCKLMKSAYKLALKDKSKSDQLHKEANEILIQIKRIEGQST
ncbi:Lacal_2735 family protein [Aquimarina sediminis]|uniref:Lacal_2735 family protein n=1 Tax=Aquimarina sediminis TaxID=2070536 RepID=UPI000CA06511|nr:Lacal_2735 family protein [Aquimarina sediminis]